MFQKKTTLWIDAEDAPLITTAEEGGSVLIEAAPSAGRFGEAWGIILDSTVFPALRRAMDKAEAPR
jgi:hypothetical protein